MANKTWLHGLYGIPLYLIILVFECTSHAGHFLAIGLFWLGQSGTSRYYRLVRCSEHCCRPSLFIGILSSAALTNRSGSNVCDLRGGVQIFSSTPGRLDGEDVLISWCGLRELGCMLRFLRLLLWVPQTRLKVLLTSPHWRIFFRFQHSARLRSWRARCLGWFPHPVSFPKLYFYSVIIMFNTSSLDNLCESSIFSEFSFCKRLISNACNSIFCIFWLITRFSLAVSDLTSLWLI